MPTAEDWYNKGVVLDKANRRFEEALQCYDKALEIDPEYGAGQSQLTIA